MKFLLEKTNRFRFYSWQFVRLNDLLGTQRIQHDLREWGETVSRRRIGRLMRQNVLVCKTIKKFKVTTNSNHNRMLSPNLLNRQFKVDEPNQVWVGDMTYIWTQSGWLYLAKVIDLFSRKVVGWSMASHMRTSLVNEWPFGSENHLKDSFGIRIEAVSTLQKNIGLCLKSIMLSKA